ncbi:MAG: PTS sugar transporter subunit IIA [Treponema sp.]|jgi:PTS system nitrogen regulatory IIA component|nr:PTS sugar transporter subunit IIA [Treponema sp.]
MENPDASTGIAELLRRGGFYYRIPGASPKEILSCLVEKIKLPVSVQRQELLAAVLEREDLMSTAAGNGVALPHPRNPVVSAASDQFAALAFPDKPVDWGALDGRPVDTVLLIVSAFPKLHLRSLQRLSFFCCDREFRSLLENRAPEEVILSYVKKTEEAWDGNSMERTKPL